MYKHQQFTPLITLPQQATHVKHWLNISDLRTDHEINVILYLRQIYFLTKYPVEDAENSIFETIDFKIFGGSVPPDPSKSSHSRRSLLWTSP